MSAKNQPEMKQLAELVDRSRSLMAFTGAGISTASGIPDYRGPNGVWAKGKPPTLGDFVDNPDTQRRYWLDRMERYPTLLARQPNDGHRALVELEQANKLRGVVTQNIDGLHLRAGHSPELVHELHGSAHRVRCLQCGREWLGIEVQARQENGERMPRCLVCGGPLRAATVLFGEPLPKQVLEDALQLAKSVDLVLAIGSSLVVRPAASIPLAASRNAAQLVIINNEPTPLDQIADLVIRQDISETLVALTAAINQRSAD